MTGANFNRLSKTPSANPKSLSLNDLSTTPFSAEHDSPGAMPTCTTSNDTPAGNLYSIVHYYDSCYKALVYPLYLITTWHALQLLCTRKRRDPARTLRSIQLDIWLRIVKITEVVEDTNLDHFVLAESRGLTP